MKSVRFLLTMLGLSAIVAGCMNAEPSNEGEGGQVQDEVHFLRQKDIDSPQMLALLEGKLTLTEGCLRIQSGAGEGYTVIWPYEFDYQTQEDTVAIINGKEQVVARVGNDIRISGGGADLDMSPEEFEKSFTGSYQCPEPHWIVNSDVAVITP